MATTPLAYVVDLGHRLQPLISRAWRSDGSEPASRRLTAMLQGAISAAGSRVVGILVSLLSVPLTIGYLGAERYGAWITIGSVLAWLQLADLGLGNGLINAVATARGLNQHERVRTYISSAFAALAGASLIVGGLLAVVWPLLDWNTILGVRDLSTKSELRIAAMLACAFTLISFPLSIIYKVFLAFQQGVKANAWGVASNLLSLAALLVATRLNGGLPSLVVATSGAGLLASIASGVWLFMHHQPAAAPRFAAVRFSAIREVGQTGLMFFAIQILALIAFQTDNLVISHYLSASQVTPYNMTYRLFGYATILQSLLFSYIWVAYTDAIARGEIDWVRRAFYRTLTWGTGVTTLLAAVLAAIAIPFIKLWTGGRVEPSLQLVLWMAAWSVINAFTQAVASLLAAAGHLKVQFAYSLVSAVINLGLSLLLIRTWGVTGVIAGTVLAYAGAVCIPCLVDAELLLRRLAHRSDRLIKAAAGHPGATR